MAEPWNRTTLLSLSFFLCSCFGPAFATGAPSQSTGDSSGNTSGNSLSSGDSDGDGSGESSQSGDNEGDSTTSSTGDSSWPSGTSGSSDDSGTSETSETGTTDPLDDCIDASASQADAAHAKCTELERLCERESCHAYIRSQHATRSRLCYDEHAPDELEQLEQLAELEAAELKAAECLDRRDTNAASEGRDCTPDEVASCDP